jgi:hypothetical protein
VAGPELTCPHWDGIRGDVSGLSFPAMGPISDILFPQEPHSGGKPASCVVYGAMSSSGIKANVFDGPLTTFLCGERTIDYVAIRDGWAINHVAALAEYPAGRPGRRIDPGSGEPHYCVPSLPDSATSGTQ